MKKVISIILSITVFFTVFPVLVYAETVKENLPNCEGITYTVDSKSGELNINGTGLIPDYVTSPFIDYDGFVKTVIVDSGIVCIGARLFRNCKSIKKVYISDTVVDINSSAFDGCDGVTEYSVSIDNTAYSSFDGVLYSKDLSRLIKYPSAKESETFETLKNTTAICKNSFKGAIYIKSVKLSEETSDVEESFDELGISVVNDITKPTEQTHHHNPIYRTVYPTCTEFGYVEYTCRDCNIRLINKYICPTQHKIVERITPATTESEGHKVKVCVVCGEIISDEVIDKIQNTSLTYPNAVYSNRQFTPGVTIVDSNGNSLVEGVDYVYSLPLGRRYVGMYNYDITFLGNYQGTSRLLFFIYPKCPVFRKIVLYHSFVELCWDKVTAQCDGYEIQYSTDPTFMSNNKYVVVNNKYAKSIKLTDIKSKKKYYFRLRSFKKVNDSSTFYSGWSNVGKAKML